MGNASKDRRGSSSGEYGTIELGPMSMESSVLELEGTWDEIQGQLPDFDGKRLRVTVRYTDDESTNRADSVEDALATIWKSTPDSAWKSFPSDFGANLDHYLYGAPKRQ
jgi:hypothetical protein